MLDYAELKEMLDVAEEIGKVEGIRLMQEKMLLACENGTPIEIDGRVYWIQNDLEHLRQVMNSLG